MNNRNPKKNVRVLILFVIMMSAGAVILAEPGKVWVPVLDMEKPPEGEPDLKILHSDQNRLDMQMVTGGFFVNQKEEGIQTYQSVQTGKYHGDLGPGYPNLPTLRRYIYIPKGKTVQLTVKPGSPVTFANYLLYPVQKPREDTKDAVDPGFYIDAGVYSSDRFFPAEAAFMDESRQIRGHRVDLLHVCPFRYNPARRILEVYPDMEIELSFTGSAETIDTRLSSVVFDDFIKGFVLNPQAFTLYGGAGDNGSEEGAELLIITSPVFLTPANALRDHKENLGINTVVKTTNETGTTKDQIKSYILNAYETWSPAPSYVLLLGDVETIPTTYETSSQRGTDLYYATVAGSDYVPDIFIGRIPVDTLEEAGTVVQKIIGYESNPPDAPAFYANGVTAAYFQDYNDYDGYEDRRFVRTAEEVRDFLITRGYSIERVYNRTGGGVDPTHYNNGYYGQGEALPKELLVSSGFAWDGSAADISSAINSGIFLLMHRDHGMDRNGGYSHTGWGDPYYVETHVNALSNGDLLPVVMSINCQTGWFDGETDHFSTRSYESFCELFLRNPNGGAVGVIGATRTSYSGYNDFLAEGFIDCVWPDFLASVPNNSGATSRLGPMLNHGKIAMDLLWGDPWGMRRTEYELFHVFGDPSMEMWTKEPGTQGTQTVRIQASPLLGVPVTVSLFDINGLKDGNTNFTRTYPQGALLMLTAPATFADWVFAKWIKDGIDIGDRSIQLTMDQYHCVTAEYSQGYTLAVQSIPDTGIAITVTPVDNHGNGNGITNFTRCYDRDTQVTLTAPAENAGTYFLRWLVDGTGYRNRTIQVTMDDIHTAVAEYSIFGGDQKMLVIDCDPEYSSGEWITYALEANYFSTENITAIPSVIDPGVYPVVFVCLGVFSSNYELSTREGAVLKDYLDQGGNLYMEGGDTWAYDVITPVHPYFGIEGVDDGWDDTEFLEGVPGTFTEGLNCMYVGENRYMDHLDLDPRGWGAYFVWENEVPFYYNGVARDTGNFKTLGVSFEFGGIPMERQISCMSRYLDFFGSGQPGTFKVIAPNGGEQWQAGAIYDICWTCGEVTGDIFIDLYKGGINYTRIQTVAAAAGRFSWDIPRNLPAGSNYQVRIHREGYEDYSDSAFSLLAKTPFRSAPDFNRDAQADILWRYQGQGGYNTVWLTGTANESGVSSPAVAPATVNADMNFPGSEITVKDNIWETQKKPRIKDGFAGVSGGNRRTLSAASTFDMKKIESKHSLEQPSESSLSDPRDDPQSADLLAVPDQDWKLCGYGDFNADGKTDIVWSHVGDGRNCAWYMNGVNFIGHGAFPTGGNLDWKLCGVGDFSLDGKSDLLWRNEADGRNAVWCMDGTTLLSIKMITSGANMDWKLRGTGDFNSDGKVDLVWRNVVDGRNAVWIMNGINLSSVQFLDSMEDLSWELVGTVDFNGDNKTDLVWRNSEDNRSFIWYMDGTALISARILPQVADQDWQIEN